MSMRQFGLHSKAENPHVPNVAAYPTPRKSQVQVISTNLAVPIIRSIGQGTERSKESPGIYRPNQGLQRTANDWSTAKALTTYRRRYRLAIMRGDRAKLFQNGGSQAVRLPKTCRFPAQREVLVRREGRRVILEPVDEWPEEFRACLGAWREEIPRPVQGPVRNLRNPLA